MVIKCEKRYQQAMAHAEKTGDNTLQDCLDRLRQWEINQKCGIILCYDHAPLSFYFEMNDHQSGRRVMNGGLLYHGNPDESNAVTFDPAKGWQIHT